MHHYFNFSKVASTLLQLKRVCVCVCGWVYVCTYWPLPVQYMCVCVNRHAAPLTIFAPTLVWACDFESLRVPMRQLLLVINFPCLERNGVTDSQRSAVMGASGTHTDSHWQVHVVAIEKQLKIAKVGNTSWTSPTLLLPVTCVRPFRMNHKTISLHKPCFCCIFKICRYIKLASEAVTECWSIFIEALIFSFFSSQLLMILSMFFSVFFGNWLIVKGYKIIFWFNLM